MNTITVQQLHQLKNEGQSICIIDVRTPAEFREIHAAGVVNIPLHELNAESLQRVNKNNETVYLICHKGSRSQVACKQLTETGIENVITIEGGTEAWQQAGYDVIHGKKAISIERQVRIAAGLFVLLGVILGLLVSPYWFGLSGFVGAGLIFAGITDTCGMGMMLARMPWNRV